MKSVFLPVSTGSVYVSMSAVKYYLIVTIYSLGHM